MKMNLQYSKIFIFFLLATFHAEDDQFFECVDFYKQPSLQHPLLQHHKLQIPMSSTRRNSLCPRGMVPIQKLPNNINIFDAQNAVHWATVDTKVESKKYHGASAVISIHNPTFTGEVTRSQIWIESGAPQDLNSIVFGWAIHPEFYGDNMTHFTTYWTSDGFQKSGCINTVCQGFIQDFSDLYPGKPYDDVSIYGGQQVVANLSIIRDGPTGNWMLMNQGASVGYWPKEIFTNLGSGADLIRYGGVATGGAPMGNGRFPDNRKDLTKLSYFKDMKYVDSNFQNKPITELETTVNAPQINCYKLDYFKYEHIIIYGGPGGSCRYFM